MARPSSYTEEIAQRVIDGLSDGQSLRKVCSADDMPDRTTIMRWMDERAEFAAKCARAREVGTDGIHDDMEDIEDRTLSGEIDPRVANVVLSSKQWRASKLAPKKWGTKVDLTSSDGSMSPRGAKELTDDELARIAAGGSPGAADQA